jgi:hypothetical protein
MNLFIDTNVFLNIYHFSNDDIAELEKLSMLLRAGKVSLITTEQLKNEFLRNRDNKVATALNEFNKERPEKQFPQIVRQYSEYKDLQDSVKSFETNKKLIIEKLTDDILKHNLKADKLIFNLFDLATEIQYSDYILNKARIRFDLGNPPGKRKSYGDAVNWQSLLEAIPDNQNIFFITDDGDYQSEIDKSIFDSYLSNEWKRIKKSEIIYYRSLAEFFKKQYPDIKLNDEYEKDLLIEQLATSGNFAATHSVLARLSQFVEFTKTQVDNILLAGVSNNQIYWISEDEDVREVYSKIISNHLSIIDTDVLAVFKGLFKTIFEPSKK